MIEFYYGDKKQLEALLKKFYKEIYEADKLIQKDYNEEIRYFLEEKIKLDFLGKMFKMDIEDSPKQENHVSNHNGYQIEKIQLNKRANLLFSKDNMTSRDYLYFERDLRIKRFESNVELTGNIKNRIASRYIRKSIYVSKDLIKNATNQVQSILIQSQSKIGSRISSFHSESRVNQSRLVSEIDKPSIDESALKNKIEFFKIKFERKSKEKIESDPNILCDSYNYKKNLSTINYLYFQYQEDQEFSYFEEFENLGSTIFSEEENEHFELSLGGSSRVRNRMRTQNRRKKSFFSSKKKSLKKLNNNIEKTQAIKILDFLSKRIPLLNVLEIITIFLTLLITSNFNPLMW